jgi:hypothetical protein
VNVSGSAQALSATPVACSAWVLKAPLSNANPIYIGPSTITTSTGYQLDPGDEFQYERNAQAASPVYQLSPQDIYVVGTSPDKAVWFASPSS